MTSTAADAQRDLNQLKASAEKSSRTISIGLRSFFVMQLDSGQNLQVWGSRGVSERESLHGVRMKD